jgi:hypothetical protein
LVESGGPRSTSVAHPQQAAGRSATKGGGAPAPRRQRLAPRGPRRLGPVRRATLDQRRPSAASGGTKRHKRRRRPGTPAPAPRSTEPQAHCLGSSLRFMLEKSSAVSTSCVRAIQPLQRPCISGDGAGMRRPGASPAAPRESYFPTHHTRTHEAPWPQRAAPGSQRTRSGTRAAAAAGLARPPPALDPARQRARARGPVERTPRAGCGRAPCTARARSARCPTPGLLLRAKEKIRHLEAQSRD